MRLWHNPASPFVRKVRILLRETNLASRVEEINTPVSPVNPHAELAAKNPLVKTPALETDDSRVLYDSSVICDYLDTLHSGAKLIPGGAARWDALRLESLCDGILDAAVLCRYETAVRPEALRWNDWVNGQLTKIRNGLDALANEAPTWGNTFGIGQIGAACVCGYLDFRFADENWRSRAALAAWYESVKQRASVAATVPA
ncbi:MAG: glutathione S-transferase [Betaproteobacteria bacterium]|nr:glutathione S-transferase [Betaproteobacteria bacterium]